MSDNGTRARGLASMSISEAEAWRAGRRAGLLEAASLCGRAMTRAGENAGKASEAMANYYEGAADCSAQLCDTLRLKEEGQA